MELNPNLNYYSVDLEENDRTVYVEAADGSCGIRLRFDEASENRLARYDRVRLDLNGCRLTRMAEPDCMTLTGVQALNVPFGRARHGRGSSREGAERRDAHRRRPLYLRDAARCGVRLQGGFLHQHLGALRPILR